MAVGGRRARGQHAELLGVEERPLGQAGTFGGCEVRDLTWYYPACTREEAERARTQIEEEVRRRAAPQQPVQTAMVTIDERRALVKSWRDAEAFRFQLADPETGAVRMLSLTDKEVDMLSERLVSYSACPICRKSRFSRQSCLCSYQGRCEPGSPANSVCQDVPVRMIVNQPVEKCVLLHN